MNPTPQKKCVIDVLPPRNLVKCRETQNAQNVRFYAAFVLRATSHNSFRENSSLVIPTTGDGFSTVSFLLPFYAKMLKNGLTPWFGDIAQFA